MTNKKHKLSYSNANWDVIHARQEKKWAQRSGEVVVIKPADPEKLATMKQARSKTVERAKKKKQKKIKKSYVAKFNKKNRQKMFEGEIE